MTAPANKFIVIPRDALDLLVDRHAYKGAAVDSASARCAESGMTMYVIEITSVVTRADRPVVVKDQIHPDDYDRIYSAICADVVGTLTDAAEMACGMER